MVSSFQVVLDHPQRTYHDGDPVTGRAVLSSAKDVTVKRIRIAFAGVTKTEVTIHTSSSTGPGMGGSTSSTTTYFGNAQLFDFRKEIYSGNYTLRANTYEWPFELQFPLATLPWARGNSWRRTRSFHGTGDPHALPPSMRLKASQAKCKVDYTITARLDRSVGIKGLFARGMKDMRLLQFQPHRMVEQPHPYVVERAGNLRVRSMRLDPATLNRKLSFREISRSVFKRNHLPQSTFAIRVECPTQVCIQGAFNIVAQVEPLPRSSTAPEQPSLLLRELRLKVRGKAYIRARSLHRERGVARYVCWLAKQKNLEMPVLGRIDLGQALGIDFSSKLVLPDFKTYNIVLTHTIGLKVVVSCAGKKLKMWWRRLPFHVLPATWRMHN